MLTKNTYVFRSVFKAFKQPSSPKVQKDFSTKIWIMHQECMKNLDFMLTASFSLCKQMQFCLCKTCMCWITFHFSPWQTFTCSCMTSCNSQKKCVTSTHIISYEKRKKSIFSMRYRNYEYYSSTEWYHTIELCGSEIRVSISCGFLFWFHPWGIVRLIWPQLSLWSISTLFPLAVLL